MPVHFKSLICTLPGGGIALNCKYTATRLASLLPSVLGPETTELAVGRPELPYRTPGADDRLQLISQPA